MPITKKQQKIRRNVNELSVAIMAAIDKLCERSDYQITYVEINIALTDILSSNLDYEVKDLWEDDNNDNKKRK